MNLADAQLLGMQRDTSAIIFDSLHALSGHLHHLVGIFGCVTSVRNNLRQVFEDVYSALAQISEENTITDGAERYFCTIRCIALDYLPTDYGMVLENRSLLNHLFENFSLQCRGKRAADFTMALGTEKAVSSFSDLWQPWPIHIVRKCLLSGDLSIRELLAHCASAPSGLLPSTWWSDRDMHCDAISQRAPSLDITTALRIYEEFLD